MFTIRPNLARSMPRSAACVHRNDPARSSPSRRSYVSMEYFSEQAVLAEAGVVHEARDRPRLVADAAERLLHAGLVRDVQVDGESGLPGRLERGRRSPSRPPRSSGSRSRRSIRPRRARPRTRDPSPRDASGDDGDVGASRRAPGWSSAPGSRPTRGPPPNDVSRIRSPSWTRPAAPRPVERDRDRRGRGVPDLLHVDHRAIAGDAQSFGDRDHDAGVRLVGDQEVDVVVR